MSNKSPITTHILDISQGHPAADVDVRLEYQDSKNNWSEVAQSKTGSDGRVENLLKADSKLVVGNYRISFASGSYFEKSGTESFYPVVSIEFQVKNPEQHYHVPLLLSPFGYSTYRGS